MASLLVRAEEKEREGGLSSRYRGVEGRRGVAGETEGSKEYYTCRYSAGC